MAQTDATAESTPGIPAEEISPGAQAFEAWRKRVGAVLAPLAFATTYFLCDGLQPEGQKLAATLVAVAVLWVSEVIPLPASALLGAVLGLIGHRVSRSVFGQTSASSPHQAIAGKERVECALWM